MYNVCLLIISVVVDGPKGIIGIPGDQGEQGEKGVVGEKGDLGGRGPPGMKGMMGDEGKVFVLSACICLFVCFMGWGFLGFFFLLLSVCLLVCYTHIVPCIYLSTFC